MILTSNNKKQVPYELYMLKKNRQPDHLLHMIQQAKNQKQNFQYNTLDTKVKDSIRKHLIQKRVNNILNLSAKQKNKKVSQPTKFVQKSWVPPLKRQIQEKKFSQQQMIEDTRKLQQRKLTQYLRNKDRMGNFIKILNLNKKIKYFGSFLSSQFDGINNRTKFINCMSIINIPKTKQSKIDFLTSKYNILIKNQTPKLFILNGVSQEQKYFYNPLAQDQYFNTILKRHDRQLMKTLIKALQIQNHFSLTSFTNFYDIFVWQSSNKAEITKFVCRVLMGNHQQLPISVITKAIDFICGKINISELLTNQQSFQLHNFAEIMKKLLFGEEYIFAMKNQYFLTRKALTQSLQRNQQCISIFINVFYL